MRAAIPRLGPGSANRCQARSWDGVPVSAELEEVCRRVSGVLAELPSVNVAGVRAFCQALGARLGRPILVCSVSGPLTGCGSWAAGGRNDYVYHSHAVGAREQQRLTLHDVAHVLQSRQIAKAEGRAYGHLFPGLSDDMVARTLARGRRCAAHEQAARSFSALALHEAVGEISSASTSVRVARMLEDLAAQLEVPR